jgi:lipopolysaccharide transport system ATP-binding protein
MIDNVVIQAEGLGKRYRIGHAREQERYVALRDVMVCGARGLWRRTSDLLRGRSVVLGDFVEDFWALRDIGFTVRRGEVLGIVGRNGAGKSTRLKILSRITEPSEGRVTIRGRVASLLEVGTGFHPELTGRENIFLNGAILGMKRSEIRHKFDEIVAFAEIEKFLDTPVKRYSSGMYVRLAFAVAAHLEPEILVVDEVLAVGDAEFQNKCLGKIDQVTQNEGRTVLFVSHNMAAVTRLCTEAIWLDAGRIVRAGATNQIVNEYLRASRSSAVLPRFIRRNTGTALRIEAVRLLVDENPTTSIRAGQACRIEIYYTLSESRRSPISCSILLFANGEKLANLWTNCDPNYLPTPGMTLHSGLLLCDIPKWPFRRHSFRIDVFSHFGNEVQDWIEEAMFFESYDGDYYRSGIIPNPDQGIVFLDYRWSVKSNGSLSEGQVLRVT